MWGAERDEGGIMDEQGSMSNGHLGEINIEKTLERNI